MPHLISLAEANLVVPSRPQSLAHSLEGHGIRRFIDVSKSVGNLHPCELCSQSLDDLWYVGVGEQKVRQAVRRRITSEW